jgi:glutamate-1-semialdehyde 2,1-aminomutase
MEPLVLGGAALAGLALTWPLAQRRLELSLAKHPSLTGHARMARRVSRWLPGYAYDEERFFSADDAPAEIQQRRRTAFTLLSADLNARHVQSIALTRHVREQIPDLLFTSTYRVPFQFSPYLRQRLSIGAFVQRSDGVWVEDLDGQRLIDLTGSYGVNVFGHDFYKRCIAEGSARVADLGPVLGSYHPLVADNVAELCRISGQQAVSFHMSGTEAVMQAVRLARYHTRRPALVRFSGAYHGWWDDVQPGPGNPMPPGRTFTLKEMDADTLRVLRKRRDIACVLVNPLQALHPNRAAPGDSALVDSSRRAHFDRAAYTAWLQQLRQVCSARGIALIFDEVFMGFRLAPWRRAGLLRCARRSRHLRQDARWWSAGGRGLWPGALDEALSRRAAGRHLLRPWHLQLAPLRDGRDAGLPGAPAQPAGAGLVHRSGRALGRPRPVAQRPPGSRACRCGWPTCPASGP